MNTLLARSDAPWFLALNSDAWPEAIAVTRLVEAATAHPGTAHGRPRLERPDGSLEHSTHRFPSVSLACAAAAGPAVTAPAAPAGPLLEGAWDHDEGVCTSTGRWARLADAPRRDRGRWGFDEATFFMYVEDLEWCWRARRHRIPDAALRAGRGGAPRGDASGAQAYGDRRTAAYLRNTYPFYRSTMGPCERGRCGRRTSPAPPAVAQGACGAMTTWLVSMALSAPRIHLGG